jgi:hypothetical protein
VMLGMMVDDYYPSRRIESLRPAWEKLVRPYSSQKQNTHKTPSFIKKNLHSNQYYDQVVTERKY